MMAFIKVRQYIELFSSDVEQASFESKERQNVINVSIRGIIENHTLHDCRRLYAPIIEPTGRLHALGHAIREMFLSAKLMVLDDLENPDVLPMQTKIIHNRRILSKKIKHETQHHSEIARRDICKQAG